MQSDVLAPANGPTLPKLVRLVNPSLVSAKSLVKCMSQVPTVLTPHVCQWKKCFLLVLKESCTGMSIGSSPLCPVGMARLVCSFSPTPRL